MPLQIPAQALQYGFVLDGLGAHSSRTIMLAELRALLAACPPDSPLELYGLAIISENVLLKRTDATRRESVRRLRELYALDDRLLLFRALRELWDEDKDAQPLLALSCALARDAALRCSVDLMLDTPAGDPITADMIAESAAAAFPGRLNPTTLANIGRHAASSWTQSGHLAGHVHKVRHLVTASPVSVTYALFLAYLCDYRGDGLFGSPWASLLDTPTHSLHALAAAASRRGWLEYRNAGGVTEITFRYLVRGTENGRN